MKGVDRKVKEHDQGNEDAWNKEDLFHSLNNFINHGKNMIRNFGHATL